MTGFEISDKKADIGACWAVDGCRRGLFTTATKGLSGCGADKNAKKNQVTLSNNDGEIA